MKNFPGPERRLPASSAALPLLRLRARRPARPPLSAVPQKPPSQKEGEGGDRTAHPPSGSRPTLQAPEPPAAPLRN